MHRATSQAAARAHPPPAPRLPPPILRDELPSTMDAARELADTGVPANTLILARRQTGGRGRFGHHWVSPPGGLYLSLILRPGLAEAPETLWRRFILPWLPLTAMIALRETVQPVLNDTDSRPQLDIKWPNDLYLEHCKLAGVLVEASIDATRQPVAIVGMGLNIAALPAESAKDIHGFPATSLAEHGVSPLPEPVVIAEAWRRQFADWIVRLQSNPVQGFAALRHEVACHLAGLGMPVTIGGARGNRTVSGRLVGLGLGAEAILEDQEGKRILVSDGHLVKWS